MTTKKKETIASFEEGLEKLEKLVSEMEDSKLPLDKLITHYETGNKLLAQCDLKLKEAEKKIEILKAKTESGPQFEPLDEKQ
ncbi:exodeoxyribonuclease VII small subunit [Pelagicoccus albus]|uniref:Exodeoxyribonuclease 7 small subunit n=1 Tax=Pelagicoccus albus TaxID=415222 RepID=A0A7X1B881_9BACT|nr:exodeoxyribonuclease VII small subunit [Pelagicoccus albus]